MRSRVEYIRQELKREPGILLLAYPYSFLWHRIEEEKIRQRWENLCRAEEKVAYIHIPFCRAKCSFCGFVAYFNSPYELIRKYVRYLAKEIKAVAPLVSRLTTDSLRIGGGTPSLLKEDELARIFRAARSLNLKKDAEISMEVFPDSSETASRLKAMKDLGINRISLGIQSFDDRIKRECNRSDSRNDNVRVYDAARKTGFRSINFDLMFGLPRQTSGSWEDTLRVTVRLKPEQVTIYPLAARHPKIALYGHARNTDVGAMIRTFEFTRDFLGEKGYRPVNRYLYVKESSPYIYKESFSSLAPVLGLGLNSISYVSDFTYKNTPRLNEYFRALARGRLPVDTGYELRGSEIMVNYVFRKITYGAIARDEFRQRFGTDIVSQFGRILGILERFNLITVDSKQVALTPQGVYYTSLVKRCFFDFSLLRKKEAYYA
jgi:oxygen-independent coproporphyrinogen III oxidase